MIAFGVLTTIAFVLILLATYSRLLCRQDKETGKRRTKFKMDHFGSTWYQGTFVTAAMILLIVAVWVFV